MMGCAKALPKFGADIFRKNESQFSLVWKEFTTKVSKIERKSYIHGRLVRKLQYMYEVGSSALSYDAIDRCTSCNALNCH